MVDKKILAQGAEAIIILSSNKNKILKKRIKKSYRISKIDEKIRKLRTRNEAKLLRKASEIIPIPKIIRENEKTKEIEMEFVEGEKLSENLNSFSLKKQIQVCKKIGENIAKLHNENIIHGDLTTSNMILSEQENKKIKHKFKLKKEFNKRKLDSLYFIDFGLGFKSHKYEDKAVDLYLLKQAIEAKHFQNYKKLFSEIIKEYKNNSSDSEKVIERLKKVEIRRRYKK